MCAATVGASADIITITAPRDCTVWQVSVASGLQVAAGSAIVQLNTDVEDRSLSRLQLALQFLALQEAALADDQIEIRRSVLKSTEDTADVYIRYTTLMLDNAKTKAEIGKPDVNGPIDITLSQAANQRATAEKLRAQSALSLFNFNINQAREKISFVKSRLESELADINKRRERMTINSPLSGLITHTMFNGAFFEKGSMLCSING
jgi:multidrug efflux pump subunit AcrA (membrane-fusion protein)